MSSISITLVMMHHVVCGSDRPVLLFSFSEANLHSTLDRAFGQDAEVPARPACLLDLQREVFDTPSLRELSTRLSWLRNLHGGIANRPYVTDTNVVFSEFPKSEILAEASP